MVGGKDKATRLVRRSFPNMEIMEEEEKMVRMERKETN